MSQIQGCLFYIGEELAKEDLARRSDPQTSKDSAREIRESGKLSRMEQRAYVVLCQYPGSTARELDRYAGSTDGAVRKRLGNLRAKGRAVVQGKRECLVTGMVSQVWWPA